MKFYHSGARRQGKTALLAAVAGALGVPIVRPDRQTDAPICDRCKQPMMLTKKADPEEDDLYVCDNFFCWMEGEHGKA